MAMECDKSTLVSKGQGLAKPFDRLGNQWLLPNSLYVPELTTTLLALSSITKNETQVQRTTSQFEIYLDNYTNPSFICPISGRVLEPQSNLSTLHCLNTYEKENGNIWHKQVGHMNKYDMKKLIDTTETSERESLDDQPKDNCHRIELIPKDDEDKDSFVEALEQQPQ
ncbi:hypothetical protein O181_091841 [Austropuccinia psidii MF-1]|uniref:GAG-pre-integrase domain-containing protein n=1 Tax=Austropuccinia psidii MF-1 TaxID=1389203 RepID=A0A9Q3PA17_9BASI|nr:hypothetical protein [Austropuccinia psidii MF-1]